MLNVPSPHPRQRDPEKNERSTFNIQRETLNGISAALGINPSHAPPTTTPFRQNDFLQNNFQNHRFAPDSFHFVPYWRGSEASPPELRLSPIILSLIILSQSFCPNHSAKNDSAFDDSFASPSKTPFAFRCRGCAKFEPQMDALKKSRNYPVFAQIIGNPENWQRSSLRKQPNRLKVLLKNKIQEKIAHLTKL